MKTQSIAIDLLFMYFFFSYVLSGLEEAGDQLLFSVLDCNMIVL